MKGIIGTALLVVVGALAWFYCNPAQYFEERSAVVGFDHALLLEEVERAEKDILILWLENQKRPAQHRLIALHQTLKPTFEYLYDEYHTEVIATEHQIGWVLHRLRYAPSKSQKREQAYLKKLSQHIKDCISLLPEKVEDPLVDEEAPFDVLDDEIEISNAVFSRTGQ